MIWKLFTKPSDIKTVIMDQPVLYRPKKFNLEAIDGIIVLIKPNELDNEKNMTTTTKKMKVKLLIFLFRSHWRQSLTRILRRNSSGNTVSERKTFPILMWSYSFSGSPRNGVTFNGIRPVQNGPNMTSVTFLSRTSAR